jgi:hypothetical protein
MKWGAALTAAMMALAPVAASAERNDAAENHPFKNIPISGMTDDQVPFQGTFDIERFEVVGEQLLAVGQVSGRLGNRQINHQAAAFPVQITEGSLTLRGAPAPAPAATPAVHHGGALTVIPAATCPVLHLTLGPLDLNLLGLTVHLNQVVLNIDAQSGPGALLGNLVCGIAHLLDIGAALASIADLLNQALAILNGL